MNKKDTFEKMMLEAAAILKSLLKPEEVIECELNIISAISVRPDGKIIEASAPYVIATNQITGETRFFSLFHVSKELHMRFKELIFARSHDENNPHAVSRMVH